MALPVLISPGKENGMDLWMTSVRFIKASREEVDTGRLPLLRLCSISVNGPLILKGFRIVWHPRRRRIVVLNPGKFLRGTPEGEDESWSHLIYSPDRKVSQRLKEAILEEFREAHPEIWRDPEAEIARLAREKKAASGTVGKNGPGG